MQLCVRVCNDLVGTALILFLKFVSVFLQFFAVVVLPFFACILCSLNVLCVCQGYTVVFKLTE